MTAPVLVTWATRGGSTEEVARAIAATLRESGLAVETLPVGLVRTLRPFSAVVLGIPLYMGHLHRDGRRFLSHYRRELVRRPTALFVLGPIHAKEEEFATARRQLEKQLARFPWLSPVAQEVFGGRWDATKLGFPFSLVPALKHTPSSDARNWPAIHAWADTLRPRLETAHAMHAA